MTDWKDTLLILEWRENNTENNTALLSQNKRTWIDFAQNKTRPFDTFFVDGFSADFTSMTLLSKRRSFFRYFFLSFFLSQSARSKLLSGIYEAETPFPSTVGQWFVRMPSFIQCWRVLIHSETNRLLYRYSLSFSSFVLLASLIRVDQHVFVPNIFFLSLSLLIARLVVEFR